MAYQLAGASILPLEPYLFDPGEVGSFQIAGFVGALAGFWLGGKLIDHIATTSANRNNRVWKPEMRLKALIIPTLTGPAAMLVGGLCFRF